MTRAVVLTVLVATLAAAGTSAQSPAAKSPAPSRVAGRVLEAGRPVRGALVMIAGTDVSASRVTVTDDGGRFTFSDLPAGHFLVVAGKPAYLPAIYGAERTGRPGTPIAVGATARTDDLVIGLTRGAAISGRVIDANGQPVVAARIRVNPRRMVGTDIVLTGDTGEPANANTDETGAYRVFGLPPGDYLVAVAPRGLGPTDTNGTSMGYAPAYFPSAQRAEDASVVTLAAGADRTGVDIHVAVARFGRIDGVVSGIEDTPANQVVLRPRGNTTTGAVLFSPTARAGADGKFNFTNVPPGEYTIIARVLPLANDPFTGDVRRGNTLWATTDVTMNSDDQRVIMRWRPGLTVSGRVTFDGESRPPDDIIVRVGIRPTPSSSGPPAPDAVPIKDDGTFTINGVMPGSYRLYVLVPPMAGTQIPQWIPASAMIDGHDAFDDAFAVRPDLGSPEIPVVLTRETQQIDGTLRDNAGRPVPNCPVVVFSTERRFWYPQSRHIAVYRTNETGGLLFNVAAGLPAGEYFVAAAPTLGQNEQFDPTLLADLAAAAQKVRVATGGSQTVQLKLRIPVRNDR